MTSSFSTDQLHQMNSALNKQLQRLGQLDHVSSLSTLKPTNPLKFSMISQSTDSTQAASHFPYNSVQDPLTHHQYSLPLSSIDYQSFSIEDATTKGLKMQRELIKLHSKVLNLEKKMTLIDTRTPPKKKSARKPTRASLDPTDSAAIQMTNFTSLSITPRSPKRLFNKTTPKNKNHNNISLISQKSPQKGFHDRRASLPKQSLPTSKFASPLQGETRIQQRRASLQVKPTKKQEQKQQAEQQERISKRRASLHVKPTKKQEQPEQEKTRRKYNVIDNSRIMDEGSMILGKVTEVQSPMRIETLEYRGYQHDVYILNNQMNQLNKEYEQDKQALKLEKKKGKELESEIKRVGKKMETLGKRIEKVQMLGEDYEGLLGSFKRSEEIRNKQRDMIGNLNYEIILLKAEKENLNTGGDKSIREKKRKTSVKKRATSQKKVGAKGL